jgi:hypothetical protein
MQRRGASSYSLPLRAAREMLSFSRGGRALWDGVPLVRRAGQPPDLLEREQQIRLTQKLYSTVYAHGTIQREPSAPNLWKGGSLARGLALARMSKANRSTHGWDTAWRPSPDAGSLTLTNGVLQAWPDGESQAGPESTTRPDSGLVLSHPIESVTASPGHYAAFGSSRPISVGGTICCGSTSMSELTERQIGSSSSLTNLMT